MVQGTKQPLEVEVDLLARGWLPPPRALVRRSRPGVHPVVQAPVGGAAGGVASGAGGEREAPARPRAGRPGHSQALQAGSRWLADHSQALQAGSRWRRRLARPPSSQPGAVAPAAWKPSSRSAAAVAAPPARTRRRRRDPQAREQR
eukprot:3922050-Heterocapsa_arctica.AAC.1